MKKMTYKTRRSLHRILTVLLIVGMALALFSFCCPIPPGSAAPSGGGQR